MESVKRSDIKIDDYQEIFKKESHHDHEIIIDKNGTYRWKANPDVNHFLENISLNDLIPLLVSMGYHKNTEVYRKLYRDMGYSLSGYYDIFYWEVNNENACDYCFNDDSKTNILHTHVKINDECYIEDCFDNEDNPINGRFTDVYLKIEEIENGGKLKT